MSAHTPRPFRRPRACSAPHAGSAPRARSAPHARSRARARSATPHPVSRPTPPTLPALAALALLATLAAAVAPADAAAQRGPRVYATIDSLRHIQSVEPRMGPVGTVVDVYTENLPPQARIHVGVGAMRAGFEALAEGTQDTWGEVSATVTVPRYATWERPLVFIVFNGIFSPIGISHPFHVTDGDGMVQRTGRITDEGFGCLTLRDHDEYMYALSGELGDLEPGDEVVVEGAISLSGPCGDHDSIDVTRWEAAPAPVPPPPSN